jgi:hypothetical protein
MKDTHGLLFGEEEKDGVITKLNDWEEKSSDYSSAQL